MVKHRVGIIGTGHVGVAAAYAMFLQGTCSEIVLVDLDRKRARGEALDLMHGQAYTGRITVRAGEYADLAGCQVVVITAGAAQKPGETRLDLLNRNAAIFASIAAELDRHVPDALLVIASNPVDILTYVMQELSARPSHRVIGTGTMLDTSRFRSLLGAHYEVDPRSVHGYILGEHGDSEFAAWSTVTIGGKHALGAEVLGRPWDPEAMQALFVDVRDAAYQIIEGKGYTNLAIGLVISRLVEIVLEDRRSVQPVSVRLEGEYGISDVCISVPCRIGQGGVEMKVILPLTDEEQAALERSAAIMQRNIDGVQLPERG